MKKSRKWLLRISILVVFISVFFALSTSASALAFKANSYIEKISDYDGGVVLNYRFPATQARVRIFQISGGSYIPVYDGYGAYHDIGFVPGYQYRITIFPFGYMSYANGLLIDTMPPSASISVNYGFTYEDGEDTGYASIPTPVAYGYYFKEGASSYDTRFNIPLQDQNGKTHVASGIFEFAPPADSYTFSYEFYWNNVSWESDPVPTGIYLDDITMRAVVDDSYLIGNYLDWTNSLLGDITDYLTNNFPTYTPPSQPVLDNVELYEEELRDFIHGNVGGFDQYLDGLSEVIREIGPGLLFFTWFLELFASISFFNKLINVVIALGITAFVLNLVIQVINRSRTESNKSFESRKDQGGGK